MKSGWLLLSTPLLILIHESGHLLFALIFRISISEIVFGVGRRLKSWEIGKTAIHLHMIPISAYVRPSAETAYQLRNHPKWHQAIFFAGGSILNIIFALLLLLMESGKLIPSITRLLELLGMFFQLIKYVLFGTPMGGNMGLNPLETLGYWSLCFGIINLLPIAPFDGVHLLLLLKRSK